MKVNKNSKIYVLHQHGAPAHYEGLVYYAEHRKMQVRFYEFSWYRQIKWGIKILDSEKIIRGLNNLKFLVSLVITADRFIVLGIAPYDYRMLFFSLLARKHNFFYHTSWPHWDGSNFPEKKFYNTAKTTIKNSWKFFLEKQCRGIFCVSNYTREQLEKNYNITCPAVVVYHSVDRNIFFTENLKEPGRQLKLLFVGRLIESKGILEIIKLTESIPEEEIFIGIAGEGPLVNNVKESIKSKSNILYYGQVKHEELPNIYKQYDILINPSKKGSGVWQELFGLSLIEGMSCGLIPVATNHIGPAEIIDHQVNGFLLRDEKMFEDLLYYAKKLIELSKPDILLLKKNAEKNSMGFSAPVISQHWAKILDPVLQN